MFDVDDGEVIEIFNVNDSEVRKKYLMYMIVKLENQYLVYMRVQSGNV